MHSMGTGPNATGPVLIDEQHILEALQKAANEQRRLEELRKTLEWRWAALEGQIAALPDTPEVWHARLEGFRIAVEVLGYNPDAEERGWLS